MSASKIKNNYLVEKRNILNELRANNMSLSELRFFSIYLARINSRDISTRLVRFTVEEFRKIMNLGRININSLKTITDSLLCKIVHIPNENGGYKAFQLFKNCNVDIDENKEWFVEIDAHDQALPLMFEFKEKYFSYQLWNALSLKSINQLRMYEILKQYENIGERILTVEELKNLLYISDNEYKFFADFKRYVIEACQAALEKNTDIKFEFEPFGKKGRGGKILQLKFKIFKNTGYKSQLEIENFIDMLEGDLENILENDKMSFYSDACNNEFSREEIQLIYDMVIKIIPKNSLNIELDIYDFIKMKYDELKWREKQNKVNNRFAYLKKLIALDYDDVLN